MQPRLRYAIALALSFIAIGMEAADPAFFRGFPFALPLLAMAPAAIFLGVGPGVAAALVTGAGAIAVMRHAGVALASGDPSTPLRFLIFAAISAGTIIAAHVQQRRARERSRRLNEQLALAANSAPVMVWVADARGRLTFINAQLQQFAGIGRDDLLATNIDSIVHPDDGPKRDRVVEEALRSASSFQSEFRMRRSDGAWRWAAETAVARRSPSGAFEGFIATCVDVDDLRRADAERERLSMEVAAERERLRAVVATVPGVVWEAWGQPDETSQRIDFVSDHVETMLGYTAAEWLSTPNFWLTIVHPQDREAAARRSAEHFARGGADTNTFRWLTRDGRAIWVQSQSVVVPGPDGKPAGMRGVTIDITARKRAEESLRLLARVSEILASSLDHRETVRDAVAAAVQRLGDWCAVSYTDPTGAPHRLAVAHADPEKDRLAQELMSIAPRPQTAQAMVAAIDPRDPTILRDLDDAFLESSASSPRHLEIVKQLGTRSMLVAPMVARDRFIGAVSFMSASPDGFDAADAELASLLAKRLALAIDNASLYRTAVESSNAKDEFLATVSHELRTPMTATLGWVRLLRLEALDDETRRTALEAIERSTQAQSKLIEDILDASVIILGKSRIEKVPVDLRAIVDAAVKTIEPAADARAISVRVDSTRWHGAIQGDPDRLQQILWNLLANAIKFGRPHGTIEVVLERDEDRARITVTDDGVGIDPMFLPHVFDRFRQAESGATRSYGGLGLGLAIVRHLAELHGGTVTAASEGLGKGATFVLEFPAVVGSAADVKRPAVALPDLKGKRILVVDDEVASLDLFATILTSCGAKVTTATSADEALAVLDDVPHDALVTDIAMSQKDGTELLMEVRARGGTPLPVIALTARPSFPDAPFDRMLRKPIDPIDLAKEVALVMSR